MYYACVKHFQLRFETEADEALRERVKVAAEASRRSMNAQILWMLARHLESTEEEANHG